ncbi:MAG: site-specific DNA-methyltransferase [Eubacteriales bacterium]|nr:site-specific DNA-methyltransferase [Eubacteriales bacterium]
MRLKPVYARAERPHDAGADGLFCLEDVREALPGLLEKYAGTVQTVYIDPPFASGQTYRMRVCAGAEDWKKGAGSLVQEAYTDPADMDEAEALIRSMIVGAKELLCENGLLFVHVDWRLSGRVRRLLDELFGEDHILNEIVWSYQTGGRAKKYFSRKHDTIFLYRKGEEYTFHIENVAVKREGARRNHMRRQVDADGRVYRTIKSGGKVYTYYDDEPAYPGDVWDDLQMQQKDPQRTGYDTQKPLRLLERVILCSTEEGDLVADLCSGSGTTLEAAWRSGRRFLGVDKSPMAHLALRRRMAGARMEVEAEPDMDAPELECRLIAQGIGDLEVEILGLGPAPEGQVQGLERMDGWAAGYLRGGEFHCAAQQQRTRMKPELALRATVPVLEGEPAVRVNDVYGRTAYYILDKTKVEYEL